MKIAFVYREGRLRRADRARSGECATEFFYGALELERRGHQVLLHELGYDSPPSWLRTGWDWLGERGMTPSRVYGGLLMQARALCPRLAGVDAIVATTPGIAFSLGLWRQLGRLRAPIVAIQLGLTDHELTRTRRLWNARLLKRMHSQVFTQIEASAMRRRYGLEPSRVKVNPFGVDTAFWRPQPGHAHHEPYLLAVGNDGRRDYDLLVDAVRETGIALRIVTARHVGGGRLPENVEVVRGDWHGEALSDEALREMYRRSRAVVVPLEDTNQPSGQSVCLQAMACGRPVILSRTRGLWESRVLRDEENVMLVPPGESGALRDAVATLWNDLSRGERLGARAHELVAQHADIAHFARRMETTVAAVAVPGACVAPESAG